MRMHAMAHTSDLEHAHPRGPIARGARPAHLAPGWAPLMSGRLAVGPPASLLTLQRLAGNAATSALVRERVAVQRQADDGQARSMLCDDPLVPGGECQDQGCTAQGGECVNAGGGQGCHCQLPTPV